VLWKCFSFTQITGSQGVEYEGAIIAAFHFLFLKSHDEYKGWGIKQAFFRTNATNLSQIGTTFIAILVVIYVQAFRVELTLSSKKARGYS